MHLKEPYKTVICDVVYTFDIQNASQISYMNII
jgi:hypothetical protein